MTSSLLHLVITLLLIAVASRHVVLGRGKPADESTGSSSKGSEIGISGGDEEATVDENTTANGEPEAVLKRKWGPVSLQAWGKRKWGATNSMAAWGKRGGAEELGRKQDELAESAAEEILSAMAADRSAEKRKWGRSELAAWGKRKWGANNNMKAWGKRAVIDQLEDNEVGGIVDGLQQESAEVARSRRSISFDDVNSDEMQSMAAAAAAATGSGHPRRLVGGAGRKRQYRRTGSAAGYGYGGPKRTWDMNTMKAWGKRHFETVAEVPATYSDDEEDLRPGSKRAWSSDNSLRIWG